MREDQAQLRRLLIAIASADDGAVLALLTTEPALALAASSEGATRQASAEHHLGAIGHYIYAGDTALHIAAAAHRPMIAAELIRLSAEVSAANRNGAQPLHYAADGRPGAPSWRPVAQAETITLLIASGADPNATDPRGVTPLHRAVRTRCAEAVRALLKEGADPSRANGKGSTPMLLATLRTGRGGSGSGDAKAEQAEIVRLLERALG